MPARKRVPRPLPADAPAALAIVLPPLAIRAVAECRYCAGPWVRRCRLCRSQMCARHSLAVPLRGRFRWLCVQCSEHQPEGSGALAQADLWEV